MSSSMQIRFWGVRGSIPCPGPGTARYGGNTPCVEVCCGDHVLIFDAGTGIRALGEKLVNEGKAGISDIFFSHCHMDHVIGLPFFEPIFHAGNQVHLWAGHFDQEPGIEDAVHRLMSFPLFPIGIESFKADVQFRDFCAGETLSPLPDVTLRTAPLGHPGGATGYRVEFAGRSVAYLTDLELGDGPFDEGVMRLAKGADVIIMDATYTDEEMPAHLGWGHSSWQQVAKFADAAGAKTACLFHHDPAHDDAFMDRVAAEAEKARPCTVVAREGLRIEL
jgi:phosphoribosyl 1,2-cyclic phosphodiesterase